MKRKETARRPRPLRNISLTFRSGEIEGNTPASRNEESSWRFALRAKLLARRRFHDVVSIFAGLLESEEEHADRASSRCQQAESRNAGRSLAAEPDAGRRLCGRLVADGFDDGGFQR